MKRCNAFVLSVLFLLALSPLCQAQAQAQKQKQAQPLDPPLIRAMETLHAVKGDPNLLVLTNAPYVRPHGNSSLPFLARIQVLTGAAVGQGNLLFFQRPQDHPLRVMLFDRSGRKAVVISSDKAAWAEDLLDLSVDRVSDPAFWKTAKSKFTCGKDLFSLVTIANAWSVGAPYDFLKAAELHNHICPGLTSGYMMAHFILTHYPLAQGQRYTMVSSPVWCKEDAFQVIMDLTPGKHGLVVKPLSEIQKKQIIVDNPAGIMLIWDNKAKTGKGIALSFDFDALKALYPPDTPKAATILHTAAQLSEPDRFVSLAKEFDLTETQYHLICQAGSNPYAVAGLTADGAGQ